MALYGQLQIQRLPVGSVQQHVFLWMIEALAIARVGPAEAKIGALMRDAYAARERAISSLRVTAPITAATTPHAAPDIKSCSRGVIENSNLHKLVQRNVLHPEVVSLTASFLHSSTCASPSSL
jgi:hypothetical protein